MSTDKEHLALPRLYGAPAHTPKRMAVAHPELPLGPDDLPMERYRSHEDEALALQLLARSYGQPVEAGTHPPRPAEPGHAGPRHLRGKPLLLRALGGRLMRPKRH